MVDEVDVDDADVDVAEGDCVVVVVPIGWLCDADCCLPADGDEWVGVVAWRWPLGSGGSLFRNDLVRIEARGMDSVRMG